MYRDLEDLTKRTLRSADERSKSIECYLKSDIEKRLVNGLSRASVLIPRLQPMAGPYTLAFILTMACNKLFVRFPLPSQTCVQFTPPPPPPPNL